MTNKERWLSSTTLLISLLPFILVAGSMQFLPDSIPIPVLLGEEKEVFINRYQYLYLGLMGFIPTGLVILARILKGRRFVERNFRFMVIAALCLSVTFLTVIVYGMIRNIIKYKVDLLMSFEFFSASVIVVSLLMGELSNFLPSLRRNEVLGLKNRYTLGDNRVWVKVHYVAADVFMGTMFSFALFSSVLSIWLDFRYGWLHLIFWTLTVSGLILWARLYARKQFERLHRKSADA